MSTNVGNIAISTNDLKKVRPDIEVYLFEGQTDFSDQVESANREEYRNISKQLRLEYPEYTEAEIGDLIAKIKDHNVEKTLYDRRVLLTLAHIFNVNMKLAESEYYRQRAYDIPMRYYIDQNEDDVQAPDETRDLETKEITFGR
ncbi:MAG: hypothetical protein U5N56_00085 [Candidatus Marinimicrobia bacterium]|nr:hypothetical protein [Candidatus Neomarinimicrobiota bacterium]